VWYTEIDSTPRGDVMGDRENFDRLLARKVELKGEVKRLRRELDSIGNLLTDDLSEIPEPIFGALNTLVEAYKGAHPLATDATLVAMGKSCPVQKKALLSAERDWRRENEQMLADLEAELRKAAQPCEVREDPENLVALEVSWRRPKTYLHGMDARIQGAGWVRAGVPGVGAYHSSGRRLGGDDKQTVQHHKGYALYALVDARDAELARYKCEPVSYLEKVAYREEQGWHPVEHWQRPGEYARVLENARARTWDFTGVP